MYFFSIFFFLIFRFLFFFRFLSWSLSDLHLFKANYLGDEAAKVIAEALLGCEALQTVNFRGICGFLFSFVASKKREKLMEDKRQYDWRRWGEDYCGAAQNELDAAKTHLAK
jgi:hypothetical protein